MTNLVLLLLLLLPLPLRFRADKTLLLTLRWHCAFAQKAFVGLKSLAVVTELERFENP
ncbi:hypothetical protein ACPCXA_23880 [Lysinibacillus agricola]